MNKANSLHSNYRYYDAAFKEKAVLLSCQCSNIFQLERDLGITRLLLHQWRAVYKKFGEGCFCGKGGIRPHQNEITKDPLNKSEKAKQKYYSPSFKEEIVIQSRQSTNVSELARKNNITPHLLHSWCRTYNDLGPGCFSGKGHPRPNPEKQEMNDLEKKCIAAEFELEIIKRAYPLLHRGRNEIFGFIKEHEQEFPLYKMCRALKVGESTYRK